MKTGRYRLRRGLFGVGVLQAEYDTPSLICGYVDSSVRQRIWRDVSFSDASHIVFRAEQPSHAKGADGE